MSTEVALRDSNTIRKPYQTEAWHETFLEEYARTGRVGHSATVAGVSDSAVYKARDNNEEFAKAYRLARERVGSMLEGVAVERAKKQSDTLLIFLLKGLMPEVHGDKLKNEMSGPGGKPISIKLVYDE